MVVRTSREKLYSRLYWGDCLRENLLTLIRVVKVGLVLENDDGHLEHCRGFRVQNNKVRGPIGYLSHP